MSNAYEILANRELGQLPVSLGTALAIESLLGINSNAQRPEVFNYNVLLVNVRTLVRNCIHSMQTKDLGGMSIPSMVDAVVSEWPVILTAVGQVSDIKVIPYLPTYGHLSGKFPKALLRTLKTPRQKLLNDLEGMVISEAFLMNQYIDDLQHVSGHFQQMPEKRAAVLTHCAVDLLDRYAFKHMDLLESHTGKLKSPSHWGSKLAGKYNHRLPFNAFTLQVYGDSVHFQPYPLRYRRTVDELAVKDNWTPITTMAKIKHSLEGIEDETIREELLSIAR